MTLMGTNYTFFGLNVHIMCKMSFIAIWIKAFVLFIARQMFLFLTE